MFGSLLEKSYLRKMVKETNKQTDRKISNSVLIVDGGKCNKILRAHRKLHVAWSGGSIKDCWRKRHVKCYCCAPNQLFVKHTATQPDLKAFIKVVDITGCNKPEEHG